MVASASAVPSDQVWTDEDGDGAVATAASFFFFVPFFLGQEPVSVTRIPVVVTVDEGTGDDDGCSSSVPSSFFNPTTGFILIVVTV